MYLKWELLSSKVIMQQPRIFTFPLTLWMGSTTTATARSDRASKLCCVLMSTPDNQQPKPGWLWYHPTTISGLMSNMHGGQQTQDLEGIKNVNFA